MAVQLQFTPQYAFAAGVFESGAQARFYESGTTTPETVYSDEALSTAHPSPLVADANGQFATVWGADGVNVKVVVTKADDGALFTLDKVVLGNTAIGNAASVSFSPTTENPATNVQAAILVNTTYNELETTVGRSVTRAADAAAQRTTLGLGSAALMVDSADADLAVDPDGAARRDIVAAAIAANTGTDWEFVETIVTTSGTTKEFPSTGTLADGYVYAIEFIEVEHGLGSNQQLMLDVYGATKAAYIGTPQTLGNSVDTGGWFGFMQLPQTARIAINVHTMPAFRIESSGTDASSDFASASGTSKNHVYNFGTAQKIDKVRFSLETGGSFDKGSMKLWRKAL